MRRALRVSQLKQASCCLCLQFELFSFCSPRGAGGRSVAGPGRRAAGLKQERPDRREAGRKPNGFLGIG